MKSQTRLHALFQPLLLLFAASQLASAQSNDYVIDTYDLDPAVNGLPAGLRAASQVANISVSARYISETGDYVHASIKTKMLEDPNSIYAYIWNASSGQWNVRPASRQKER